MKVPCCRKNIPWIVVVAFLATGWCLQAGAAEKSPAKTRPVVEECKRCHDVAMYQNELRNSSHTVDKDKKEITCDQCHHFHYSPLTSYYARDEYYDKKIFEPGTFDRRKMQVTARKSMKPEKCQACHKDLYKNVKGEPISEIGKLCHDAFLGKNGETRRTCAGCHINIAHLPPFDRKQPYNAEFAKKLMENQPKSGDKGGQKK